MCTVTFNSILTNITNIKLLPLSKRKCYKLVTIPYKQKILQQRTIQILHFITDLTVQCFSSTADKSSSAFFAIREFSYHAHMILTANELQQFMSNLYKVKRQYRQQRWELVYQSTRHTVNSSHGQLITMDVDHKWMSPPAGDTNANCLPRFCHDSKFQAPDCLHYNAVKSLPTP